MGHALRRPGLRRGDVRPRRARERRRSALVLGTIGTDGNPFLVHSDGTSALNTTHCSDRFCVANRREH
jgi:hypothetical protein